MNQASGKQELVGRGGAEAARLFRRWYQTLTDAAEHGEKAAYVFVMGNLVEVLRTFDLHIVFPEINSLQTAVRHQAQKYLLAAEDYGYSPDICGYVKADAATQLSGGEHLGGRIPKPSLVIPSGACNTYIKWAEIWERLYRVPMVTLDIPSSRSLADIEEPDKAGFERDRRYVEHQIRELISQCERVTARKFDIDRMREVMANVNRMSRAFQRVLELNRHVPAPFNGLTNGTVYLGVANALRGTVEGAAYFERLVEELEYKVAHGLGALPEENYRLLFTGVPCYPIFRDFGEFFAQRSGVFVSSTYMLFASGGLSIGYQYDLDRPVESLAAGLLTSTRAAQDGMFYAERVLGDMARDFHADGVVFHPIKSCRTVSTGLTDIRRVLMQRSGIPSLHIESDMMDKRAVSEAQLRNRIDAFFEVLASKRLHLNKAENSPTA